MKTWVTPGVMPQRKVEPNPEGMEKLSKGAEAFLKKQNVPTDVYKIGLTLRMSLLSKEDVNHFSEVKQKRLVTATIWP